MLPDNRLLRPGGAGDGCRTRHRRCNWQVVYGCGRRRPPRRHRSSRRRKMRPTKWVPKATRWICPTEAPLLIWSIPSAGRMAASISSCMPLVVSAARSADPSKRSPKRTGGGYFEANVDGAFWLAQAVAPAMKKNRVGAHRQHFVRCRTQAEPDRHPGLCVRQTRPRRTDQAVVLGTRAIRHHREFSRAGTGPFQPEHAHAMGRL